MVNEADSDDHDDDLENVMTRITKICKQVG